MRCDGNAQDDGRWICIVAVILSIEGCAVDQQIVEPGIATAIPEIENPKSGKVLSSSDPVAIKISCPLIRFLTGTSIYNIEKLGDPHVVGKIVNIDTETKRILILEPGNDEQSYWFSFNENSEMLNDTGEPYLQVCGGWSFMLRNNS